MALKNFFSRFTTPVEALDKERLREFCSSRAGVTGIADVRERELATVVGEISNVRIVPRADGSPWLEATVTDGTGSLVAMWTGRRRIAGIRPGQRLVLSGRGSRSGHATRLLIYNPIYELL